MPSDNIASSRMARATDLISSLINAASSPCHQPQQLPCLHHDATFVCLCALTLSSQPHEVTICHRHIMASVRDIKITEALFIQFLAYYVVKQVRNCWNWGVLVFMYQDMGGTFHKWQCILHVFHNGWARWIAYAYHTALYLYCCVTDRTYLAEYEAYWFTGISIINPWGTCQPFFFLKQYALINQP